MNKCTARSAAFWIELEKNVTVKVSANLKTCTTTRAPLIAYLRDLEVMARTECDRRQTIQVIVSGRRLLGDRGHLEPTDGPFSATW